MFSRVHDILPMMNRSRLIMNFDLIGILVLLRMIALLMLIAIVVVTNVFTTFGAFVTYFLNGILFLLLGTMVTRSEIRSDHVTGVFGPFVGILGFAYTVGSIVDANGLAKSLGNGRTPTGLVFYVVCLMLAVFIHFAFKKYLSNQSTEQDSPSEDES